MDLRILEIASYTENNKTLKNFTHKSKHKNPLCGDEMEITLKIKNKKILAFGYQCKSCIYCQASVSLLSRKSINKEIKKINELIELVKTFFIDDTVKFKNDWLSFAKLFKKGNISRKECLMLPFNALLKITKDIK